MLAAVLGRRWCDGYRLGKSLCPASLSSLRSTRLLLCCPQSPRLPSFLGSSRGVQQESCPHAGANTVKPLDGVRILDLTRVLAGPFATMNLGDLGAEVIKVEKPGSGDDTRSWGPPFIGKESVYFLSINRNKKSIAVNMKNPKGAKIIREGSNTARAIRAAIADKMTPVYRNQFQRIQN